MCVFTDFFLSCFNSDCKPYDTSGFIRFSSSIIRV